MVCRHPLDLLGLLGLRSARTSGDKGYTFPGDSDQWILRNRQLTTSLLYTNCVVQMCRHSYYLPGI